ncbi:hypothetical protein EXU57_06325 [Segetibacter sp. 3557_3]|uniref:translocation/assembly module TamB domain-containing protein n=1 Tax=Segetibacter sp. 3557_3 TaxID=2547429 RepID=UPI001058AA19|nr:translocation/assembly module TamB domain-containing protein [Segetibacter sp. 3557_3]TDH28075.1 hypothetical protein EXU57_06325 [Segetibacter sp. 3557_3]
MTGLSTQWYIHLRYVIVYTILDWNLCSAPRFVIFTKIQITTHLKKFLKITARIILSILGLVLLVWILLQTELVQNWIVGKVTKKLSKELETQVSIKHVSFAFFNRMNLEGTLVRDQQRDTLLYADQLKVRITDWFFLQDTIVLKFAGLQDAQIHLSRKDSTWNYGFLVDYFSAPSPKKKKKSAGGALKFDLKVLDFKNVLLVQDDRWIGQKMEVKLGSLQLDAENFNMDKGTIEINELDLDKPLFSILNFEGLRPDSLKRKPVKSAEPEYYFNPGNIRLTVGKIKIRNGSFYNEKRTDRAVYQHFDGLHLRFDKLNGSLSDVSFIQDTIRARVDLSGKERSGFEVRKLKAQFRLTPEIMEFANLDLITPKSHLQNYYAMSFSNFNTDFGDYMNKVTMHARFLNTEIDSDDLAFFAPEAKAWNKRISISGIGTGTVANLSIQKLFVNAGSNTTLSGNVKIVGLPDINTSRISFTGGSLRTTYNDVVLFVPEVAKVTSPSLPSLGTVQFKGDFNGTISKFITAGTFSTSLGGFSTNLSMELPAKGSPVYNGRLVTKQFNLGKFLQSPELGRVSFDGTVNGTGLNMNTLRTNLTGNFQQLEFHNYNYKNIGIEGVFQRKQFDGTLKVDDENLDITTTVKIDLTNTQPRFNVLGDLVKTNLQNLNFTNERFELSGLFDLDFSGRNIDQFLGSVKIFNATFLHDSTRLNLDSLSLQSRLEGNQRMLSLNSNEFDASVQGEYSILDLPNSFQLFLHQYYPSYINKPRSTPKDQRFAFLINTRNVEGYTQLLDPHLSGFSNSEIAGNINTIDTIFAVKASVPELAYRQYRFTNTVLDGKGNLENLQLTGDIDNISVSDSASFPLTHFNVVARKDSSEVSLQTRANTALNDLDFNASVVTLKDGVTIDLRPSEFVLNDKRWRLEKEGQIIIRKNFVSADKVRFTQGDQEIAVETTYEEDNNQNNLAIRLRNLNIGDFAPFITSDPRLEGIAGGEIVLKDFFGKFNVEGNLRADQFRLDNDSIGVVLIKGGYNSTNKKVVFNVESLNELYSLTASGSYDIGDSVSAPLTSTIRLNNTKIDLLNRFLGTVFDNVSGFATGELSINGNPNRPQLLGRVAIRDGSLLVKFTQVTYTINSATFVFHEDNIDFGQFSIRDKFGNTGSVRGKLYNKGFRNMRFDFDITTKRMLLIDTKSTDNKQFYGTAIGTASLSLDGPQENMRMSIVAEPTDSSQIYIPTNDSKESGEADFIVFKQYGTEMRQVSTGGETNIVVDLELTANPLAKIDVILDELTGDIIKANGNGRLKIHAGTTENLTINGRYEIVSGSYDFNFQSFIKKPFILRENAGSYIEWNGDPFDAKIQIEALYIAQNVKLSDLVGSQNQSSTIQGYKDDVYVYAVLTDRLKNPTIRFRLDFPTGSGIKNDDTFVKFLAKLESDDNEMLKQVTYLIVFGGFAPYGEGRNLASNFTTLGYNTLSQMISKQVNSLVSNLLFRLTGDRSLQFDVSTSLYNSQSLFSGNVTATNTIDRQQVNFKLGKSLLDNKVIVTVGGDLDFKLGSNSATSQQLGALQFLPDITVEIILSKNRKVRAIVFSRNNLDITEGSVGRRNRQGVSISYRQDFDKFFGNKVNTPLLQRPPDSSIIFK